MAVTESTYSLRIYRTRFSSVRVEMQLGFRGENSPEDIGVSNLCRPPRKLPLAFVKMVTDMTETKEHDERLIEAQVRRE